MGAINLGTVLSQNGRTTSSGLASGLDSSGLIESITQVHQIEIDNIQDEIDTNSEKLNALSELKSLLDAFQSAADFLRNPPGIDNASDNVFEYRTASIASNTTVAGSTYLAATASPGAVENSYDLDNIQLAQAHTIRQDGFTTKDTSVVGSGGEPLTAGTFTLNGISITLEDGDTLEEIESKINGVTSTSNVVANIVEVSSSSFSLVIKSTLTGSDNKITEYDDVGNTLTFGGSSESFTEVLEEQDAQFNIDGLAITRSSNVISDVIDNVTFTLNQATPVPDDGTIITVNINNDQTVPQNGVIEFLNAYNNLKVFDAEQRAIGDDGLPAEGAALGSENTMREILSRIDEAIATSVTGISSSNLNSIFTIGVDYTDFAGDDTSPATLNIFNLDTDELAQELSANFDDVRKIFEFDFTTNSPNLGIFARENGITLNDFTLDIDDTRDPGDEVRVLDKDTGETLFNMTLDGTGIKGQEGTALEGLTFVYTGDGSESIDVHISQGIGDQVYNVLDDMLEASTGFIDTEITRLTDQNERLELDLTDAEEVLSEKKDRLILKFSEVESVISRFNAILEFLKATNDALVANA